MVELNKLFLEINIIKEKHKREDFFNAFMSFGIGADETKHSRFIGMLLNPKGSHKQGETFLKLFKEQIVELEKFELRNSLVDCEKLTFDNRRIDIGIENDNQMLIIENKFKAQDQPRQLIDYHIYGKTKKNGEKNIFMIYLTRYGSQPTKESLGELDNKNVICISYEKHILQWLEACIDSINASDNISLKISLEMYVELIRNVINRDKYMTEIMNKLLSNSENMKLAIDIAKSFQQRNFLDSVDTREFILDQIDAAIYRHSDPKLDFDRDPDKDILFFTLEIDNENTSLENTKIGDICFSGVHIYGQKINGEEIKANQIVCNDINDINLYNLLTNNTVEIDKWLESIVSELLK